jgi:hypothetical protein
MRLRQHLLLQKKCPLRPSTKETNGKDEKDACLVRPSSKEAKDKDKNDVK